MQIHHGLRAVQLGVIASLSFAGISDLCAQLDFGQSARFQTFFEDPEPNLQLPEQVVAPQGEFTLFADFGKTTENGCPIYLVNRTSRPIVLLRAGSTLNGLKLTHAVAEETWARAQSHSYIVDCISGDTTLSLLPGQHLKATGYAPVEGTAGKVRYQLFDDRDGGPVSNEGTGLWSPKDVEDASQAEAFWEQLDAMSKGSADFNEGISTPAGIEDLENELAKLDLDSLANSREALTSRIQALKNRLAKVAPTHPAWKRLAGIEARPSETLARGEFLQRCLEMIQASPPAAKGFGRPESRPWVVWNVIDPLLVSPESLANSKEALKLAESRLAHAGVPEKIAIARLFRHRALMAEIIPN